MDLDLKMLTSSDHMWSKERDYAKNCSLGVGGKNIYAKISVTRKLRK